MDTDFLLHAITGLTTPGRLAAAFLPAQYNTGRWTELFGSSFLGDSQYVSQHGVGGGGALGAPFALAVRSISPSVDGSFDMTVQYEVGADDLGFAPTIPLGSATIDFDICPGLNDRTRNGPGHGLQRHSGLLTKVGWFGRFAWRHGWILRSRSG